MERNLPVRARKGSVTGTRAWKADDNGREHDCWQRAADDNSGEAKHVRTPLLLGERIMRLRRANWNTRNLVFFARIWPFGLVC
jgi:hypothetical protein